MDKKKIELGHYAKVLAKTGTYIGKCPRCDEEIELTLENNFIKKCPNCNSYIGVDPKKLEIWLKPILDEEGNIVCLYNEKTQALYLVD